MNKTKNTTTHSGVLNSLFGGVTAKIMDFLIVHNEWDYSKQDIANYSGTSLRHAIITIEKLEKYNFIKHTRNVGAAHMYQFNNDNPTLVKFAHCARQIAADEFQKFADQQQQEKTSKEMVVAVPA